MLYNLDKLNGKMKEKKKTHKNVFSRDLKDLSVSVVTRRQISRFGEARSTSRKKIEVIPEIISKPVEASTVLG